MENAGYANGKDENGIDRTRSEKVPEREPRSDPIGVVFAAKVSEHLIKPCQSETRPERAVWGYFLIRYMLYKLKLVSKSKAGLLYFT